MVYPVTAASNTNTAQASVVPGPSDFQQGTAYSQQGPTYTQLQPPQYGISPFRATDTDPLYGPSAITTSTYTGTRPQIQTETVPQLDNSSQYQS